MLMLLMNTEFIAIGGSLGSMRALSTILTQLPSDLAVPIAVVLHRQASADNFLVDMLQRNSKLNVQEASDKQTIKPSVVTIAPANYHLLIDDGHYALDIDEAVSGARPSIDVLFESVANNYNSAALAVILTGGGIDGAQGTVAIMESGGEVLVQNPLTAEAGDMPSAAIAAANISEVYPLNDLVDQIVLRCQPVLRSIDLRLNRDI